MSACILVDGFTDMKEQGTKSKAYSPVEKEDPIISTIDELELFFNFGQIPGLNYVLVLE